MFLLEETVKKCFLVIFSMLLMNLQFCHIPPLVISFSKLKTTSLLNLSLYENIL